MTSDPRAALREKVARAIAETQDEDWENPALFLADANDTAESGREAYRDMADAAIAVVLEEAARLTDAQSQVFRDEAHNQKVWGDTAMSKRALSIAHHFAQHAAAIRGLKGSDT